MASHKHNVHCPKCNETSFREEKIVQLDSSVVVRADLEVPARTVRETYRYVCMGCGEVVDQPWVGHHEA